MAVINDQVWPLRLFYSDPQSYCLGFVRGSLFEKLLLVGNFFGMLQLAVTDSTYESDFSPGQGRTQITMAQHAEAKKRQSNALGEKDSANLGRYEGEGIANYADHEILEYRCLLYERRPLGLGNVVPLITELVG